jgi:hypothetical protein
VSKNVAIPQSSHEKIGENDDNPLEETKPCGWMLLTEFKLGWKTSETPV